MVRIEFFAGVSELGRKLRLAAQAASTAFRGPSRLVVRDERADLRQAVHGFFFGVVFRLKLKPGVRGDGCMFGSRCCWHEHFLARTRDNVFFYAFATRVARRNRLIFGGSAFDFRSPRGQRRDPCSAKADVGFNIAATTGESF
jgi:hypothetical protein